MDTRGFAIIAAVVAGLFYEPAKACSIDPFLFRLPGETEKHAAERSQQIRADYRVIQRFEREKYSREKATHIYLARVISRTRADFRSGVPFSARVRPIASAKGDLPTQDRTLIDETRGGMCWDVGDGEGAFKDAGGLVLVFEGLPKTPDRPRGTDSFHVSSIRSVELLDWLREQGEDLED